MKIEKDTALWKALLEVAPYPEKVASIDVPCHLLAMDVREVVMRASSDWYTLDTRVLTCRELAEILMQTPDMDVYFSDVREDNTLVFVDSYVGRIFDKPEKWRIIQLTS